MNGNPIFIEAVPTTADSKLKLCQRIIGQLNAKRIAPLHFAALPSDAVHMASALDARKTPLTLVVLNAYGLEIHQGQLESHFVNVPMLIFQRPLGEKPASGMRVGLNPDAAPRSRWNFGPLNAVTTAQRATHCIEQFLRNGRFKIFDEMMDAPVVQPPKPRRTQTNSKPFFGMV